MIVKNSESRPRRGRPPGPAKLLATGPRSAALADANQALRDHLSQPAELAFPERGNRFDAYYSRLRQLPELAPGRKLRRWWLQTDKSQLTQVELAACWRWLLPQ